ncbi:MAG TPA: phenylalanine--tRNA ligase subunit beta [Candidatus Binatia bacterium]|jgi:phenylalanyl-tRNA synthetase beta chain|nr:phenylalanine--tRNA ligase subunit beta [Candidatus Binatia bacterium]
MRVPLSWLAEFVTWRGPTSALVDRLTLAGLEVASVEEVGRLDARIRVGRLVEVAPHPAAEKLRVCRVDVGDGAPIVVVSGAPGLAVGQRVPAALPGALLPNGERVAAVPLRGVESAGVLCSETELDLGDDASQVLVLPGDATPGTPLVEWPGVADTVLDVEVTPNRGDWLSILGVAREIAAVTGTRLRHPRPRPREGGPRAGKDVRVEVEAKDLCPRYCARLVRNVTIRPSPLWMRLRLRRAGMRAINAVVDVTNYVMLERGQPLHAFDLDRLAERRIVVRRAAPGERITTLDGVERRLERDDLVIADAVHAVAIAGVMGGEDSEVTAATRHVVLESAWFAPSSVRRTARRTGIASQAAYRFERRVDPAMVREAVDGAAVLIARAAGGRPAPGIVEDDDRTLDREPRPIRIRTRRTAALLGTGFPRGEIARRLRALGARTRPQGDALLVTPPSWRGDLRIEEDLIEEVARVGGYDAVPVTLPEVPLSDGTLGPLRAFTRRVRRLLVAEGLTEMVTLAFTDAATNARLSGFVGRTLAPLAVKNPLSSETGELRRSPLAGLVRSLRYNLDQGAAFVGAFELGKGYGTDASGARQEPRALAVLLAGAWPPAGVERSGAPVDFLDLKGILGNVLAGLGFEAERVGWRPMSEVAFLHPGKAAVVALDGEALGGAGALHPEVAQACDLAGEVWVAELDLEKLAHYVPARVTLKPVPRFPSVTRDLAVIVEEPFYAGDIVEEVRALAEPQIESIRLFDCYRGAPIPAGKKSLAYSIAYRSLERTLTDDEVNRLHAAVLDRLRKRFRLEFRM